MKSHNGITAFLDILGYQNFIDRNEVAKAVDILNDSFANLKTLVADDFKKNWVKGIPSTLFFDRLSIQTLSDSIIIHLPFENNEAKHVAFCWGTVLQSVRVLQRRLFDRGFPSRGAIAVGDYYFSDGFLVGKPFMEAYRLSQRLDLAATALTPIATEQIDIAFKKYGFSLSDYIGGTTYLAPIKGGKEEPLYMLSMLKGDEIKDLLKTDLAHWVHRVFWMHDKEAGLEVDAKIANTVKFLRFCIVKQGNDKQGA